VTTAKQWTSPDLDVASSRDSNESNMLGPASLSFVKWVKIASDGAYSRASSIDL
jgi:hypothetical protein